VPVVKNEHICLEYLWRSWYQVTCVHRNQHDEERGKDALQWLLSKKRDQKVSDT
jgi:hypothetical protein